MRTPPVSEQDGRRQQRELPASIKLFKMTLLALLVVVYLQFTVGASNTLAQRM